MKKNVRRYINALPADRKCLFNKLQALILSACPKAEVVIWWGMPTYEAKSGWVALANQKKYISLYTNSASHIPEFKEKYPAIKTGKACINFRPLDPIPAVAVKQVIRHAIKNKD